MLTYLSAVWSGTEDPFWPHVILVPLSVVASLAVGAGIVFEGPKYCAAIHRIAFWLVVAGVAVEALCTVMLFVTDERISLSQSEVIKAQRDEIIALETRIAPRNLSLSQQAEIASRLKPSAGAVVRVESYALDPEASDLGEDIIITLKSAHIVADDRLLTHGAIGKLARGIRVSGSSHALVAAIISALGEGADLRDVSEGVPPTAFEIMAVPGGRPTADATIFIGVKPLPRAAP